MKALAAALVEAQKQMPVVPKTATANTGKFSYSYATLDNLIEKTKPVLIDHGLVISQFPTETMLGHPGLKTVLMHGESGESIEATVPLLLNGNNDMQALGSAISYARRYGWAAVLGIANDEDDDGATASARPEGRATQTSAGSSAGGLTVGGSGDAAVSPGPSSFQQPASSTRHATGLQWKYGPHAGRTLDETPLEYVVEYAATGTNAFMKGKCQEFLSTHGAAGEPPDSDIPFDRTVDGLGN